MNITARIPVTEDDLNLIQFLSYEMEGLKVLNCHVIRSGGASNEVYEKFLKDFQEAHASYHLTFDEIIKKYAGEYAKTEYRHTIDFLMGDLVVEAREAQ